MRKTKPVELAEGLWWVGQGPAEKRLECNPYVLMHGGSVIVFDPGSVLDAEVVIRNITELTPINEIEAVVLSHQDPDLCSALPLLEQAGFSGVICCHERTSHIITFYGIASAFYQINKEKYRYQLKDGTCIRFIPAPYLHFPGAIMTYLPQQKVLISGDLFGAVTEQWTLFAQEDYQENMKTFHETYMPSRDILQPVMNQLLFYDIRMICPQHGSVISSRIQEHIEILRDLPCGQFMDPVHQDLFEAGGYPFLCSQVLKRYLAVFGTKEVREAFAQSDISIDYKQKTVKKFPFPESQLWDEFFDQITKTKGVSWLTAVSPLVEYLSKTYNIQLPRAFASIVYDAQKNQDVMHSQYQELENQKLEIESKLHAIEEKLSVCPVTKLFNQDFFEAFLTQELQEYNRAPYPFGLMMLTIDNLADVNLQYGSDEGDTTLRNLTYIIRQITDNPLQTFRLEGGIFALYLPNASRTKAVETANIMRNTVSESNLFITPVTISIGLHHSDELDDNLPESAENLKQNMLQQARSRLKAARSRGKNSLIFESLPDKKLDFAGTVLLIDAQGLPRDLIQRGLEQEGFQVITADDGLQGRQLAVQKLPDVMICELMIPKLSGLTLRKDLLKSAECAHIPFILMSANKHEDTVRRAVGLGISHFFARPVMQAELTGAVSLMTRLRQARNL